MATDGTVEGKKHQVPEINHRGEARQREDRMLFTPAAEEVWEVVGTQLERSYIGHRQGMESQWVALRPIFEVCTRYKSYEGGGFRRSSWWCK